MNLRFTEEFALLPVEVTVDVAAQQKWVKNALLRRLLLLLALLKLHACDVALLLWCWKTLVYVCRIDAEIAAAAAMPLPDEEDDNMDWAERSKAVPSSVASIHMV
jgi:hypothetical protein